MTYRRDNGNMIYFYNDEDASETVRYRFTDESMLSCDIDILELADGESEFVCKNGSITGLEFYEQYRVLSFVLDCRREFGVGFTFAPEEAINERIRELKYLIGYEQYIVQQEV